jgi:hypothetical protein
MSTKYEKLIEYIINDDEAKARELFHQIVVEKSRDIYESLIDEQDLEEVGGNPVGNMVDEISADETGMAEDEEDEDGISLDGDDDMDGMDDMDDMDGMDDMGDDMGGEGDMEDRVMDLEDALDELKAEFDALMAGENAEDHDHAGMHDMGSDDMDGEGDEMEGMYMEAKDDEDAKEDMLKSKKDSKKKMTEAEWIREYVEKIGEYPGEQANPSGKMAGTGAKSEKQGERNTRSVTGPGADMGGTTKNTARGGAEADVFGKTIEEPTNEYAKGRGQLKDAGKFANVPGKDSGHTSYKHKSDRQPETNDPEKGKLVGNDGTRPINKKSPLKHIGK